MLGCSTLYRLGEGRDTMCVYVTTRKVAKARTKKGGGERPPRGWVGGPSPRGEEDEGCFDIGDFPVPIWGCFAMGLGEGGLARS